MRFEIYKILDNKFSSMASKPNNIRRIRTSSQPYFKNHLHITSYYRQLSTNIKIKNIELNINTSFVDTLEANEALKKLF